MRTLLLFAVGFVTLISSADVALAQRVLSAKPAAVETPSFDQMLTDAAKFLASQPGYSVNVHSAWTTSRGAEGQNAYWLTVGAPGQFRIEVQSGAGNTPELVCVSDGKQETTLLTTRNLYSRLPAAASGVNRNQMLSMSLAGSGLDVLMQPNIVGAVHSMVSDVKPLGTAKLGGSLAHGYEMTWANQHVQLYFAAEGSPLLRQFVRKTRVATDAETTFELEAVANFQWKLDQKPAAETFVLNVPKDAKKVHDIYAELAGDESTPVGQPLPSVEVALLDGGRTTLVGEKGKPATVLIFWASWCAPSVTDMPAVTQFVKGLQAKGIGVRAVNVAESAGDVRRFATKNGLEEVVVIDSSGELACQLQLDDLPAAVVLDDKGVVHSVLQGKVEDLKNGLGRELATLAPAAFSVGRSPAPTTQPKR